MQAIIDDLDMYDDIYFKFFLRGEHLVPIVQLMLRRILGRPEIRVRDVHLEHEITNPAGRDIRMDICAVGDDDTVFDVEIQRDPAGASPHRARINSSTMDANIDLTGVKPRDIAKFLPPTYVIFITQTDVLGRGLPLYTIDRMIRETGEPFGDGSHIIYVNGAHEETTTDIGELIHDMRSKHAAEMLIPEFADRTRDLKGTKKGEDREMGHLLDTLVMDSRAEGHAAGIAEGRLEGRAAGIAEGRLEGRAAGRSSAFFDLVRDGILSPEIAADRLSMSADTFAQKYSEYTSSLDR